MASGGVIGIGFCRYELQPPSKSDTYSTNTSGESTPPCDTPDLRFLLLDTLFPIFTLWDLSAR